MDLGMLIGNLKAVEWSDLGILAVLVLLFGVVLGLLYLAKQKLDAATYSMIVSKLSGIQIKLESDVMGYKRGPERMLKTIELAEQVLTAGEIKFIGGKHGIAKVAQKIFELVVSPFLISKLFKKGV